MEDELDCASFLGIRFGDEVNAGDGGS